MEDILRCSSVHIALLRFSFQVPPFVCGASGAANGFTLYTKLSNKGKSRSIHLDDFPSTAASFRPDTPMPQQPASDVLGRRSFACLQAKQPKSANWNEFLANFRVILRFLNVCFVFMCWQINVTNVKSRNQLKWTRMLNNVFQVVAFRSEIETQNRENGKSSR